MKKNGYDVYFTVVQGNMSENGNGDEWDCGRYENYEEAKKRFEEVKNDTTGIEKKPNGYLETYIAKRVEELESRCQTDNIIELYDLKY